MKRIKDILYVGIQFILFIIYALVPHAISFPFPLWFIYFGLAITLLGLLVISLALLQLNKTSPLFLLLKPIVNWLILDFTDGCVTQFILVLFY
jgi:hypothetical protein